MPWSFSAVISLILCPRIPPVTWFPAASRRCAPFPRASRDRNTWGGRARPRTPRGDVYTPGRDRADPRVRAHRRPGDRTGRRRPCGPGVTTEELDAIGHEFLIAHDAYPSTLGYRGYPKSICTSVNEVICHGIPDDTVLDDGDIVNIDITAFKNGFHGDSNQTFIAGTRVRGGRRCSSTAPARR